jgi:hypothetical protein
MDFFDFKKRERSYSAPFIQQNNEQKNTKVKYYNVHTYHRSQFRPAFKGCNTAGAIFISKIDGFTEICKIYNSCDKSKLSHDHPYSLCSLPFNSIKRFPQEAETDPLFKSLVTDEIKAEAKKHVGRVNFGLDFIYRHCIQTKSLGEKYLGENFHLLCQLVVPNAISAYKYNSIDLTGISGKTDSILGDTNILKTLIRETQEEIGLKIGEYLPNGKPGILHPSYQLKMRQKYNVKNLPYDLQIGEHGYATQLFILVIEEDDILDSSILEEEKEIDRINEELKKTVLKNKIPVYSAKNSPICKKFNYSSLNENGWISGKY